MKTVKRILIIAMTVLLFGSTLSCAKKASPAEMSEKELLKLIEEDATKLRGRDIKVCRYYGVYGESAAVGLNGFEYELIWNEEINGVLFTGNSIQEIVIWKNGEFCDLREAVDKGFLTVEQLEELAYVNNNALYKEYRKG
jgi:hypothetical protein